MVLAVGLRIANRYEVQRPLGTGGQADVYVVFDHHQDEVVALKLLKPAPSGREWDEARILRSLSDEHILPIRNADLDVGQPYLVTELATHGTLDGVVEATMGCGLLVDDAVRFVRQACHGIARAHDLRLLHNDIKPANLFLNDEGECMVGDFGFAAKIPSGATSTTAHGGSAPVMAPEVAAQFAIEAPTASVLSDIYSLGATAYWLLAGRPPYLLEAVPPGPARWNIVASQPPPRLRDVAPHVPPYVATAVERAMNRNPPARFQKVTDFADALGRRPEVSRRWRRTNQHKAHLGCWLGEPESGGSTYATCLAQGSTPKRAIVTSTHLGSGRKITAGCRGTTLTQAPQALRSVFRALS
ncbi:MAG: serine/threonine-protein kinase [Solirubrobacteraceae bacterium]